MAFKDVPSNDFGPRIDEDLKGILLTNKDMNQRLLRPVPDLDDGMNSMHVAVHSVYRPPEDPSKGGQGRWRSFVCRDFDYETNTFKEGDCPFCKIGASPMRDYYVNMIDRAAEDNPPRNPIGPSDHEAKTGYVDMENNSRATTPMRVVRFSVSNCRSINTIAEGNTYKGVAYPVEHPDHGVDLRLHYNEREAPAKRLSINPSTQGQNALTDEQLGYLCYRLDPNVYFPKPSLASCIKFMKENPVLFRDKMCEKQIDENAILDLLDEYDRSQADGRSTGAARGRTASRNVGTDSGAQRRSADADADDDIPPAPSRGRRNAETTEPAAPARASRGRGRDADDDATPPARAGRSASRGRAEPMTRMEKAPNPLWETWRESCSIIDEFTGMIEPVLDSMSDADYDFVAGFIGDDKTPPSLNAMIEAVNAGELTSDAVYDITQSDASADGFDELAKRIQALAAANDDTDFDALLDSEPPKEIEVEVAVEEPQVEDEPPARSRASSRAGSRSRATPEADPDADDDNPPPPRSRRAAVADGAGEDDNPPPRSRRAAAAAEQDPEPAATPARRGRAVAAAADEASEDDGNPAAGRTRRTGTRAQRSPASFEEYN